MLGYPVPLAMATQHPDSASRGFTAREEVEEALHDLLPPWRGGLGLDEKMVDYEGKLTPYHQVRWIVDRLLEEGLQPGEDFLVTPRVPSERLEEPERQVMVLWGVIFANKRSLEASGGEAVRYIVNPMSGSGYEMYVLQRRILKLQRLAEEEVGARTGRIEVVPLLEDYDSLIHADEVLEGMKNALLSELGVRYESYRVLLGKSDAALTYGHLTSSLALVQALSRLHSWAEREETRVYPILGVGALPFRGHLSPWAVEAWRDQYSGYSTATIQSGLRYDQGPRAVARVVAALREGLYRGPRRLAREDERLAAAAARVFTREYLRAAARLADAVARVARFVPRRRERLEASRYPRSLAKGLELAGDPELRGSPAARARLPRAITYAAALYTMGAPPALLGTGRGLREASRLLGEAEVEHLASLLPLLPHDIGYEASLYAPEILRRYVGDEKLLAMVEEDVELALSYAHRSPGAPPDGYLEALEDAWRAIAGGDEAAAGEAIARAGVLRGSLG